MASVQEWSDNSATTTGTTIPELSPREGLSGVILRGPQRWRMGVISAVLQLPSPSSVAKSDYSFWWSPDVTTEGPPWR